jgi:NTP pyrophosphatase (non-canonical NTP hydrolase)
MEHFNSLTPAQAEALAIVAEECGEVIQAVAKILRHGLNSYHPTGTTNNVEDLEKELGDLKAAVILCGRECGLSDGNINDAAAAKLGRINRFLHHVAA